MSVYFTYRYYTAKQSDVREGNIREEVYLQDQWCKWENVLRHIALYMYRNPNALCRERKVRKPRG